jgi:CheY-like chemotaxis protein
MASAKGIVLLVDDEDVLLMVGMTLLETLGFSVMIASNGREALESYRDHAGEIDVIVMDLAMPEMGGMEAYRKLRSASPSVAIILCSGYFDAEIEVEIEHDIHASLLEKPYKPSQLEAMLLKIEKNMIRNGEPACNVPGVIS